MLVIRTLVIWELLGFLAPLEFPHFKMSLVVFFLLVHVYHSLNLLVELLTSFSVVKMFFFSGALSIFIFHGSYVVSKTIARETCCRVISACSH